ncbi:MAG: DUF202 domain-containing protein [gamma proteobacterium symbiont of Bathyaustriella thionipta]|nr:DUF202 domain-containing protein [gamma proteobacterium symbiont of Bathyaustriella thionipta]
MRDCLTAAIIIVIKDRATVFARHCFTGAYMPESEPDRNTLALDRTILANERTYQAWLRTGLAALASGLGVVKFMREIMPLWMLLSLAGMLILLAVASFLQASWRYSHIHVRMAHLDIDAMPVWITKVVSLLLAAVSVLVLVGLLVTALR